MVRPFLRLALRRPGLLFALAGAAWAFRRRDWMLRPPFLPLPSPEYMRWRMETAYGDAEAVPPDDEIAAFVVWSADMRCRMRPRRRRVWGKLAAVAVLVAVAVWVNVRAAEMEGLQAAAAAAGYPGLLAASVVSGFNLITPIPIAAFYPFLLEAGFSPVPTLAVISAGMTAGDFLGCLIGSASREIRDPRLVRARARLESLLDSLGARHRLLPYGILFLYAAFAPVPNELVVIPLAFAGFPLAGVMAAVLAGNAIFNTLFGLLAEAGAGWLQGWVG